MQKRGVRVFLRDNYFDIIETRKRHARVKSKTLDGRRRVFIRSDPLRRHFGRHSGGGGVGVGAALVAFTIFPSRAATERYKFYNIIRASRFITYASLVYNNKNKKKYYNNVRTMSALLLSYW